MRSINFATAPFINGLSMRIALVDPSREAQFNHFLNARGDDVLTFATASEALASIEADDKIDALIASAKADPTSGVQLCWETRLLAGKERALYVLLMAPSGDRNIKIEALDCGADDVIDEPPAPDELCAKLRVAERMLALQRELIRLATTDYLSQVFNRGAFFDQLTKACRDARIGGSLALILLDVDRLKSINDHYGHYVGDHAIQTIAGLAQTTGALVGRLGGDEFSLLLRGHNLTQALKTAAGLQQKLADLTLPTPEGLIGVTCSLGVSELQPGDTVDDLMKRADLALYRAKTDGRNCVATTPANSWMSQRPRQGVSLARLLPRPCQDVRERRNRLPASDELLARVCAVIDLLIASGLSEDVAAQTMSQKMLAAGIPAPKNGKVSSWEESLLAWRAASRNGTGTEDALREYRKVVAAIESIAPHERVESVLENELWDRRR